jgi:hypothetical protein
MPRAGRLGVAACLSVVILSATVPRGQAAADAKGEYLATLRLLGEALRHLQVTDPSHPEFAASWIPKPASTTHGPRRPSTRSSMVRAADPSTWLREVRFRSSLAPPP